MDRTSQTERDNSRIGCILSCCTQIGETVQRFGDSYEAFEKDRMYHNACAFCIYQIAEQAGNLSESFRAERTEINWQEIRKMQDLVSDPFAGINLPAAWTAIKEEIPVLRDFCEKYLDE